MRWKFVPLKCKGFPVVAPTPFPPETDKQQTNIFSQHGVQNPAKKAES